MTSDVAVLTGDIVGSQDYPEGQLDAVFAALGGAARQIAQWSDMPARLTRVRGDGWQLVTPAPLGLRAMLVARSAVRSAATSADSRVALGQGAGRMPSAGLGDAEGDAFVTSGRQLDTMPPRARLAAPGRVFVPLLDHVVSGWTRRQSQVAFLALDLPAPSQSDIAERLGITRQTVQRHLDSAGLPAVLVLCRDEEDRA